MCSTFLVIAGAAFEVFGLTLVFIEVAILRSHDRRVPTPWARAKAWIERRLTRPQTVEGSAAMEANSALEGHAIVRPGDPRSEATDAERIERLERYVQYIDADLGDLRGAIQHARNEIITAARQADDELRDELARREAEQRARRAPALTREAVGAVLVLIGIGLGTWGNLA